MQVLGPHAVLIIGLLVSIAAEPHRLAIVDGVTRGIAQHLHRRVQIGYALAGHIAQVFHGVELAVGIAGIIDHAHVLTEVCGQVFLGKLLRGKGARAVELIILIAILPDKVFGRQTQVGGEDTVDVGKRLLVRALFAAADPVGGAAQHGLQVTVQHRRGLRRSGFRHGVLRYYTVFFHQCDKHGPLSAVIDRIIHELGYGAVRNIAVLQLSHGAKEPIGLLELVKEVNIGLGKLKIFKLGLVHQPTAQGIQAGKNPAAARSLLVGHAPGI